MAKNESVLIPIRCVNAHKEFYARYDYAYDGKWVLTYGLKEIPQDGSTGSGASGTSEIDLSNSRIGPQYKCPYCGNRGYVKCSCGANTCYPGGDYFTCDSCHKSGTVGGNLVTEKGEKLHSQV